MEHKLPTLGFIGTGTLTTALVTGFCSRAAFFSKGFGTPDSTTWA